MSEPENQKPANGKAEAEKPRGTTGPSSADADVERFDSYSAAVPDAIGGEAEFLPPEGEAEASGWPVWNIQQIATLPFLFLAKRYGEQWELDASESLKFATSWKPILDRYVPLEKTGSDWGTALLVTLAIVAPRAIATDWEKQPVKAETKAAPTASTKTAGSTASRPSSASGAPGSQPEWDPFSESVAV